MARLGFNIESITQLRESAGVLEADPVHAAFLAELGGADAIVCPINEEFNPVKEKDVKLLKAMTKVQFILQIGVSDKLVAAALTIRPDGVTLTPKGKSDSTANGGLDVAARGDEYGKIIKEIRGQNMAVGCLVDPILQQIKAAAGLGADWVALNAAGYTSAQNPEQRDEQLDALSSAAMAASKLGLGVSIGRGIHFQNASILAGLEKIEEVHVGRAIVGRSILIGMEQAVRDMAALVH